MKPTKTRKRERKVKIKRWLVVSEEEPISFLTPDEGLKKPSRSDIRFTKNLGYKIVPATITYSLPTKK